MAYRRFLETSGKDLEVQRRLMLLQQKVKRLESENSILRQRLTDVAQIKGQVSNHFVLRYTVFRTNENSVDMLEENSETSVKLQWL